MRKITERQKDLILKALTFYRQKILELGLPEANEVVTRIDLLFIQLSEAKPTPVIVRNKKEAIE